MDLATRPAALPIGPPRVVLVDPDDATRAVVGQALADAGCEVDLAPNQAQGLVAARRRQPTVIVTEVYRATILTPSQYIEGLRRHAPGAVIIARGATVPTSAEAACWGLWAAVPGTTPAAELLRLVRDAHAVRPPGSPTPAGTPPPARR
jgi:DNA-binding NtrC family response regulator